MIVTQTKYYCDYCWKRRVKTEANWGYAAKYRTGHVCVRCEKQVRPIALKMWPVQNSVIKH